MKRFRVSFLVIGLSLMLTGMAYAVDIPNLYTWMQSMGVGGGSVGMGDLLLAPLYDVRNLKNSDTGEGTAPFVTSQQTLISIVNTDDEYGVIARIRFREPKRSDEVLDFDIPLSCNDVWVAEVSRLPGGGAIIKSPDRWINASPTGSYFPSAPFPTAGISFKTDAMPDGTASDKLARTEYGYIEIIGEERVRCEMTSGGSWVRDPSDKDVKDKLFGHIYLIRPEAAISHQYNMNAYSDFSIDPAGIWAFPITGLPNLQASTQGQGGNLGIGGFNQLEAIMAKRFINFEYVNGTIGGTPMSTDVVITFPTKHFHYNTSFYRLSGADWMPFTGYRETLDDGALGGEVFKSYIYDRDENLLTPPEFPVSPGTSRIEILPWEVNVIGLLPLASLPTPASRGWRDNLLMSTADSSGNVFNAGWASIDLSPDQIGVGDPRWDASNGAKRAQGKTNIVFNFMGTLFPTGAAPQPGWHWPACTSEGCPPYDGEYRGLPAIGIVMTEFFNTVLKGYYGNTVPWQYQAAYGESPLND